VRKSFSAARLVVTIGAALGLLVALCVVLFPFAYAAVFSFAPLDQIFSVDPRLLPQTFTTSNYSQAIGGTSFGIFFRNSLIVSLATVVLSVSLGALAGYSLACLEVPGRQAIAGVFLLVYMFPSVLVLIPLYLLIAWLGLADTLLSLIVAYTTFSLPFATWSLRSFFISIPPELREAAKVDGCTELGALRRVILPLAAPGIATAAVFSFILSWNELLYALTFITSDRNQVVTIGISSVLGQWSSEVGTLLAFTVLAGLPVLIFFVVLNRLLIQGLTAGSVKG
jgi:multiple sugar transport system permease protein